MNIKIEIPPFKMTQLDRQILDCLKGSVIYDTVKASYEERQKESKSKIIDLTCDECGSADWNIDTEGEIFGVSCGWCGALR